MSEHDEPEKDEYGNGDDMGDVEAFIASMHVGDL